MGAPPQNAADLARTVAAIRQLVEAVPAERMSSYEVMFKHLGVQPPAALYITRDDCLRVTILTSVATTNLVLGLRLMGADGCVRYDQENLDGVSLNTLTTKTFVMREGFLLGAVVSNQGGGMGPGQCFVSIGLQYGTAARQPSQILAEDYVTNIFSVEWPASAQSLFALSSTAVVSSAATVPAAGAEISFTVASGTSLQLANVRIDFTTAVAVATRSVNLQIKSGGNILYDVTAPATQAASLTKDYDYGAGLPIQGTTSPFSATLPNNLVLAAGMVITTNTTNIQAADQYNSMRVLGVAGGT